MSRAINNWIDRERPVEEGRMDDVKLSTKGVTTSGLRAMIASRNADVMMSADSSYEHGWHDCADDVALPIAEERDALRAEVERLQTATVWLTYDPDDGYDEFSTEDEARSHLDDLLESHTDTLHEGVHEDVEQVALYRCVRVAGIQVVVTARAEDQTEGGAECRERGWDYMVELDIDDTQGSR